MSYGAFLMRQAPPPLSRADARVLARIKPLAKLAAMAMKGEFDIDRWIKPGFLQLMRRAHGLVRATEIDW
jgi:hypothetical protein